MFRIHPAFFDIIAILLSVFMLISVLMAKNIQQEYLTKVDMVKKAIEDKHAGSPGADAVSLTVISGGKGKYEFVLSSKKIGKKVLSSILKVKEELSRIRPAKIALRVDRTVPTGITQELLYDAQGLGILPYLTVERK